MAKRLFSITYNGKVYDFGLEQVINLIDKNKIMYKQKDSKESVIKPELYTVLTAGFDENNYVEGVFLIGAKCKDTFWNRKQRLDEIAGFSDGGFGSYEEDEEGGCWRIITTAHFETVDELKTAVKKMEKYSWIYLFDTSILLNGEYLYCDGKWFV